MDTAFTRLVGVRHPLIQAPMAGISTPELAAAVSNSGALGSVAVGSLGPDAARSAIRATRALTDAPFAVNVFVHTTPHRKPGVARTYLAALGPQFTAAGVAAPTELDQPWVSFNDNDDVLAVVLEERPSVVSLHFGIARPEAMQALREAGITILACATSVPEALLVEETGAEAVVVQGYGAGGHSGAFLDPPDSSTAGLDGLLSLVGEVTAVADAPVIAAGGIMTGGDIRSALDAGASAVQLGTAFVACPESAANDAYRDALARGGETRMTSGISGRPARGLENEMFELGESLPRPLPDYPFAYDGMKRLAAARNEPAFTPMWAGDGVDRIRALPARDLVEVLMAELGLPDSD